MVEVKCPDCGTIKEINGTEERVRCASKDCGKRFYTKDNIVVPEKRTEKDNNGTAQYRTTARNKGCNITVEVDYNIILKCMDRAISSIRNKKEVKEKKGGYYFDSITWKTEIDKIEEIAKVMKLMGEEK